MKTKWQTQIEFAISEFLKVIFSEIIHIEFEVYYDIGSNTCSIEYYNHLISFNCSHIIYDCVIDMQDLFRLKTEIKNENKEN